MYTVIYRTLQFQCFAIFYEFEMRNEKKIKSKCDLGGALWQKVTGILIMTVVGPPCLCQSIQGKIKLVDANVTVTFHNKKNPTVLEQFVEAILDLRTS